MGDLWQDVRYAARVLAKSPGFALVALAALALGIGANAAIFTVVNAALLRPLPYPEPGRLALLVRDFPSGTSESLSALKFDYLRRHTRVFEGVAAYDVLGVGQNLTGAGEPERVPSIRVSASFFRVAGVQPALGRGFTADEENPNAAKPAVISHGLWQRRFGGDAGILGKPITLGGEAVTVVGVMPQGFQWTPEADILIPLRTHYDPRDRANMFFVLTRMKPDVSLEEAKKDADRVYGLFRAEHPDLRDGDRESFTALGYHEYMTGNVRRPLLILLAAVGLVLLIACANVANLLLARATARQKEIALRTALGAGAGRIVRQLLTESLMLSLAGGALGLVLARIGLNAIVALGGEMIPQAGSIEISGAVLGFTLGISLVTAVVFGLAPAISASRTDLHDTLREGSGRAVGSAVRHRMRKVLVVAEVALAVVLLAGATLLLRAFDEVRRVDPGFVTANALTFQQALGARYATREQVAGYTRQVQERIELIPGVRAAGLVTSLPTELGPDLPYEVPSLGQETFSAQWRNVTPHTFDALGMKVIEGRGITETDSGSAEAVIVVNESLAKSRFKGRSAVGERILVGRIMGPRFAEGPRQIVGVVKDVREQGLDREAPEIMYIPTAQIQQASLDVMRAIIPFTWVVRTSGASPELVRQVRSAVLAVDSDQPVAKVRWMEEVVKSSMGRRVFITTLLGLFAALALLLAAVGIYGVLSYSVQQRTQEIGVRLALGASAGEVTKLVAGESLRPALAGALLGVAGAFGLSRFLEAQLYGVTASDPLSFAVTPLVLLGVSVLASLAPLWRALRIDPVVALRYE